MPGVKPILEPVKAVLQCAREGNVAEALGMATAAVEAAAPTVVAGGAAVSVTAIGWPVYAGLAAGLLGLGIWNGIERIRESRKIRQVGRALQKLTEREGSLTKAAEHMLKRERAGKRPLTEIPYSLMDNASAVLHEILAVRHDQLAATLQKHEGFYVSLGEYLYEHFDDFKTQFNLAQNERAALRHSLDDLETKIDKLPTAEDLTAAIAPLVVHNKDLTAQVSELAQRLGVAEGAVQSFFTTLGRENVPPERWPEMLIEIAVRHREMIADLRAIGADDAQQRTAKQAALQAIEGGDYDTAETMLNDLVNAELDAAGREQNAANARYRAAAESTAILGDLSMTQIDYRKAAERFARAADLVRAFDDDLCTDYLVKQARALYMQGGEKGDNEALEDSIAGWKDLAKRLPRVRVPFQWAAMQNNLGSALLELGKRETGTDRLDEAVAVCHEALTERTRERVPLQWATTQNNLGNALSTLGERETGTDRLDEAVTAYREALTERTRDRVPLAWAVTQNDLGNALMELGKRDTGTARLQQAVAAYREALTERTQDLVPLEWAATQNNLGTALGELGQRETGTDRLEQAIAAYREALTEYTQARVPLQWAMTQNNLGAALFELGQCETGTDRLELAVTALRAALAVVEEAGAEHYVAVFRLNLAEAECALRERRNPDDDG